MSAKDEIVKNEKQANANKVVVIEQFTTRNEVIEKMLTVGKHPIWFAKEHVYNDGTIGQQFATILPVANKGALGETTVVNKFISFWNNETSHICNLHEVVNLNVHDLALKAVMGVNEHGLHVKHIRVDSEQEMVLKVNKLPAKKVWFGTIYSEIPNIDEFKDYLTTIEHRKEFIKAASKLMFTYEQIANWLESVDTVEQELKPNLDF